MDALSDVLRVVGLTGGVFMDAEFTEPWSVVGKVAPELCGLFMLQPAQVVCFHYVVEGGFELRLEGEPPCTVVAGEAVLMPRNDLHVLGSDGNRIPVSMRELIEPPGPSGLIKVTHGGGGARTRLVCGFLGGAEEMHPLLASLPPVMKIDIAGMPGGDWIGRTFTYAAQTLGDGDPGAATVVAKLSELLFVEAIRRYLAGLPPAETGWLAGLRDPAIGRALSLMHGRVAEAWTSEALARAVNMSRSTFADRFTGILGQPPMRYLTAWRMQLARHRLAETRQSVAQIAFAVGYESEAAFNRAFHRECGSPPATWRRQAR
ncbi:MAG: AraC family transcriptional regulator [Phenylobacterium sp.]|nr:MAG: AraC family transcriptional regulator [Phenylobacterium sp.]